MKILQKILSHGLLITVVVAAFFIYTNRAGLLPKWFGKADTTETARVGGQASMHPAEQGAAHVEARSGDVADLAGDKVASVSEEPDPDSASVPGEAAYRPMESEAQSTVPDIKLADAPEAVATPTYRPQQPAEVDNNTVAAGEADADVGEVAVESAQPAEQVADSSETEDAAPPSTAGPAAPKTSDVAALDASSDKTDDETLQQRLEEARQHYWQRNVSAASEAYEALGRDHPRNADVWGEIGNFYYSIRQSQPAGVAYYRTVSLLIDSGDTQKARQLLGVLYALDADRGRELDARLHQSAESPTP